MVIQCILYKLLQGNQRNFKIFKKEFPNEKFIFYEEKEKKENSMEMLMLIKKWIVWKFN